MFQISCFTTQQWLILVKSYQTVCTEYNIFSQCPTESQKPMKRPDFYEAGQQFCHLTQTGSTKTITWQTGYVQRITLNVSSPNSVHCDCLKKSINSVLIHFFPSWHVDDNVCEIILHARWWITDHISTFFPNFTNNNFFPQPSAIKQASICGVVRTGISLGMSAANERWRGIVTWSLNGWAYTQNNSCKKTCNRKM